MKTLIIIEIYRELKLIRHINICIIYNNRFIEYPTEIYQTNPRIDHLSRDL